MGKVELMKPADWNSWEWQLLIGLSVEDNHEAQVKKFWAK